MRAGRAGHRPVLAGALAMTLASVAGCGWVGDDDETTDDATASDHLQVPAALDDDTGCDTAAVTSPADHSASRTVARCAPDAPAAAPLALPVLLRVGVRERTEDLAPLLLADHYDEFAAENLTVELVEYDTAEELYGALGRGEVDVAAGDLDGPFFDLVYQGSGARVALGGAVTGTANDKATPQSGVWLRTDLLDDPTDWVALENHLFAVEDGIVDATAYPINSLFRQADLSLNEVDLVAEGGEVAAARLANGELSGAWLRDPYWRQVLDSDFPIELVATLPAAESIGGYVLAERLVDPARDRAVGLAFTRAIIRTVNTYLGDDYQCDDGVVTALSDATDLDEAEITGTPAWVFDWELREGTTSRIQEPLIELGGVLFEDVLPERQLVDRSLYEDAVRAQDQG